MVEFFDVLGVAIDKHAKSSITKNAALLSSIFLNAFDLRRRSYTAEEASEDKSERIAKIESSANENALKMIFKLNDAAFRPIFVQFIEWTSSGLPKSDKLGRTLRQYSLFSFLHTFFDGLKSIVTNYASYIIEDAVKILNTANPTVAEEKQLWSLVLKTLARCFEHDQDDFWQAPAHFSAVSTAVLEQFKHAPAVNMLDDVIPATVELAAAADSQAHQKEINSALLKHLRSEQTAVRLAAVHCEQALTDRLGEEWLSMLHEMLPRISELQEDDDEVVERETHRWIVKIEGVLGESLDAMLQ
jgi:U3 small nucleolar RNA-associated protein 10